MHTTNRAQFEFTKPTRLVFEKKAPSASNGDQPVTEPKQRNKTPLAPGPAQQRADAIARGKTKKETIPGDIDGIPPKLSAEYLDEKPNRMPDVGGAGWLFGDESMKNLPLSFTENPAPGAICKGASWWNNLGTGIYPGQTTTGFYEKIRKQYGFTLPGGGPATVQLGRHDIIQGGNAKDIYKNLKLIWKKLYDSKHKVNACTVISDGMSEDQKKVCEELNEMIRNDKGDTVFNVIDMEDCDITSKSSKSKQQIANKIFGTILQGKGVSYEEMTDPAFSGPPEKTMYTTVGDSFTQDVEKSFQGAKKEHTPVNCEGLPGKAATKPGESTGKILKNLPNALAHMKSIPDKYRAVVIQGGAEDVMGPLNDYGDIDKAFRAISGNLRKMYDYCLTNHPPVMIVAMTLPPMNAAFRKKFKDDQEAINRHKQLWDKVNAFILSESRRLATHPNATYKRIELVRPDRLIGNRHGEIKTMYRNTDLDLSSNKEGNEAVASRVHSAIKQMVVGIGFSRVFHNNFSPDDATNPAKMRERKALKEAYAAKDPMMALWDSAVPTENKFKDLDEKKMLKISKGAKGEKIEVREQDGKKYYALIRPGSIVRFMRGIRAKKIENSIYIKVLYNGRPVWVNELNLKQVSSREK